MDDSRHSPSGSRGGDRWPTTSRFTAPSPMRSSEPDRRQQASRPVTKDPVIEAIQRTYR